MSFNTWRRTAFNPCTALPYSSSGGASLDTSRVRTADATSLKISRGFCSNEKKFARREAHGVSTDRSASKSFCHDDEVASAVPATSAKRRDWEDEEEEDDDDDDGSTRTECRGINARMDDNVRNTTTSHIVR